MSWFGNWCGHPAVQKRFGIIKPCAKALKPGEASKPSVNKAPAKPEAEDDDLDLFGGDDEPAPKVKVEVKKKKKEVIAMSLVMLEVKPLDSDTVLDDLAKKCFSEIK